MFSPIGVPHGVSLYCCAPLGLPKWTRLMGVFPRPRSHSGVPRSLFPDRGPASYRPFVSPRTGIYERVAPLTPTRFPPMGVLQWISPNLFTQRFSPKRCIPRWSPKMDLQIVSHWRGSPTWSPKWVILCSPTVRPQGAYPMGTFPKVAPQLGSQFFCSQWLPTWGTHLWNPLLGSALVDPLTGTCLTCWVPCGGTQVLEPYNPPPWDFGKGLRAGDSRWGPLPGDLRRGPLKRGKPAREHKQ
jgi:hypothetical protein